MMLPPNPRLRTTTPKTWPSVCVTRCPAIESVVATIKVPSFAYAARSSEPAEYYLKRRTKCRGRLLRHLRTELQRYVCRERLGAMVGSIELAADGRRGRGAELSRCGKIREANLPAAIGRIRGN